MKKEVLILLIILILTFSYSAQAQFDGGAEGGVDYTEINWDDPDFESLSTEAIQNIDPQELADNWNSVPSSVRNQLTSDQLSTVISQNSPASLGDLGDYDGNALTSALQSQGYDTSSLEGDLSGVEFEGDTLTFPDGSSVKAKGTGRY